MNTQNLPFPSDLTGCTINPFKTYLGSNGAKICAVINGKEYMIKFPCLSKKNPVLSYANSSVSEYLGCHIFEIAGIPVQETKLATYTTEKGKKKLIVACGDLTGPGIELKPFAGLKNQCFDSPSNGYGTELSEIIDTFQTQKLFDYEEISNRFWDMFIVDALIGNWDRHNGNWGYLYNSINNTVSLAPVYDCGSSLFPQADEKIMKSVLTQKKDLDFRVYSIPLSSIKIDEKKINYRDFICSMKNTECNRALKRIYPRLDMKKISKMIDETPFITPLQKDFLKTVLSARRDIILKRPYELLTRKDINTCQNEKNIKSNSDNDNWGY